MSRIRWMRVGLSLGLCAGAALLLVSAAPAPIKIMPLGDSITAGDGDGGYRCSLRDKLAQAGFAVDMAGTMVSGSCTDNQNEGHGGFTIGPGASVADDWSDGHGNIYDNIESYLATDPDVILMLIGVNEYFNSRLANYDPDTQGPTRLAALIDKIYSLKPTVTIFVSSLTPASWDVHAFDAFNAAVPGIVAQRAGQGRKIYFVDMAAECGFNSDDYSDALHPGASGYQKMATVWYNALRPYIEGTTVTDSVPRIYTHPQSATVLEAARVSMKVVAGGRAPLSYQWLRNTSVMNGKTADSLVMNAAVGDNGAVFKCVVRNALGADTSDAATLTVNSMSDYVITPGSATVDGSIESVWSSARGFALGKTVVGSVSGSADCGATWKAMWSTEHLYVLAQVTDDVVQGSHEPAMNYQDDGVEVYLDMGAEKASSYDANDRMLRFAVNSAGPYEIGGQPTTGIRWATTNVSGGYVFEASIPWALTGVSVSDGRLMGFDVHVNDADAGSREGKLAWWAGEDNAWSNPSLFGAVVLRSTTSVREPSRRSNRGPLVSAVRSGTGFRLVVDGVSEGPSRVTLADILARTLAEREFSGSRVDWNVPEFAYGGYFVTVRSARGTTVVRATLSSK